MKRKDLRIFILLIAVGVLLSQTGLFYLHHHDTNEIHCVTQDGDELHNDECNPICELCGFYFLNIQYFQPFQKVEPFSFLQTFHLNKESNPQQPGHYLFDSRGPPLMIQSQSW